MSTLHVNAVILYLSETELQKKYSLYIYSDQRWFQIRISSFYLQQLVRRKPSASFDADYARPKPVQNETYKLNDCKKYIENLGKEIVSDSKKEFTNFVKQFDSYELKKKSEYLILKSS